LDYATRLTNLEKLRMREYWEVANNA
jgi:hypothetical protein